MTCDSGYECPGKTTLVFVSSLLDKHNPVIPKYDNRMHLSLVDGEWGYWGEWSDCSATCGSGEKTRSRQCDSPAPMHGGADCDGDAEEIMTCDSGYECPGRLKFCLDSACFHQVETYWKLNILVFHMFPPLLSSILKV